MKPRVQIAETTLPDGSVLGLHEHDGRHYLQCNGMVVAGPSTRASEHEMARLACAPFRPARQPKLWIAGIALGETLKAIAEHLPQKRGTLFVAEPSETLLGWHRGHLEESPLTTEKRLILSTDPGPAGLAEHQETLHAILVHADTAPRLQPGKALFEDHRWLPAAYQALQPGGLLAIASSRKIPQLDRQLAKAGFTVAIHEIDASPGARRPRMHFLWLGRKGDPSY